MVINGYNIIIRDDDVGCMYRPTSNLNKTNQVNINSKFINVHEIFKKYQIEHTVGIVVKKLLENQEIYKYLTTQPYINIALHGWEHVDYSKTRLDLPQADDIYLDIKKGKEKLEEIFKTTVKYFLPPWHLLSNYTEQACKLLNLIPISVSQVRGIDALPYNGWVILHFWDVDLKLFDKKLQLLKYGEEKKN